MRAHEADTYRPPGDRAPHGTFAESDNDQDLAVRAAVEGRMDALTPNALLGLQRVAGNAAVVQRAAEPDAEVVQRADESLVHEVIGSGSGSPLDQATRSAMEGRFGQDFADVRVHTDDKAHRSAKSVNAHAYTVGSDIVFQRDAFNPSTPDGQLTLAHELTHVVQQRGGPVDGTDAGGGVKVSDPSDRFEREAVANAERVMSNPTPAPAADTGPAAAVQRHSDGDGHDHDEAVQRAEDEVAVDDDEAAMAQTFVQRESEEEDETLVAATAGGTASVQRFAEGLPGTVAPIILQRYGEHADVATSVVQREPPTSSPTAAPQPTVEDFRKIAIGGMRAHLPALLNLSYSTYEGAVAAAKAELLAKKIETPPKSDPLNVALTVGMALVPWESFAVEAAAALLGSAREGLQAAIVSYFIRVNPLPFPSTLGQSATNVALDAMAAIAGALRAEEGTLKTAYKAVTDGWKEQSKSMVVGNTALQQTLSYLDSCANEAANQTLAQMLSSLSDDQVMSVWTAHAQPNLRSKFVGDLRARADHFMTLMTTNAGDHSTIQRVDAWGRVGWARVRYNTTSANYFFIGWITPDLQGDVERAYGGDHTPPLTGEMFNNHVPDPYIEQERIVWVDAWGKLRLARVGGEEGQIVFREWIPSAKWVEAQAEAQNQIRNPKEDQRDGVALVDPGKVRGLTHPLEP